MGSGLALKYVNARPDHIGLQELARAGYKVVQEHAFLPNQYFLEFVPQR